MRLLVLLPLFAAVTVSVMAAESKSDSVETFEKQLENENPAENMKEKFGQTYALYVKLRYYQLQLKSSYDSETKQKAFAVADEIIRTAPKSQFAEAAKYLKGVIQADQLSDQSEAKAVKAVKKYLEDFVKENPDGLYRGEALMLLGKISLECEWDAKETEKYYEQALAYFRKACEKQSAVSMYDPLSENLKRQAEPVTPLVGVDFKGSVKLEKPDPLKLYNTEIAPEWYAKEQASECALTLMWLAWHRKDRADAKKYMAFFSKYDDYQREQMELEAPATIRRYSAVIDDNDPVFTESELKGLSSKAKLQMACLTDFYLSEYDDQAVGLIDKLLKNPKITEQERGCFLFMRARCMWHKSDDDASYYEAIENYQESLKHLDPQSDMYAVALLKTAITTPPTKTGVKIQLLEEYVKRFPHAGDISLAHGNLLLTYAIGGGYSESASKFQNLPLARKMLEEHKEKYKDSLMSVETVERIINRCEKKAKIRNACIEKGITDWNKIDKIISKEMKSEEKRKKDEQTIEKKKDEQTIEKKRFLPWLLDDFKITKAGAELSITKEKADYYNLRFNNEHVLESQKINISPNDGEDFLRFGREIRAECSAEPTMNMLLGVVYAHLDKVAEKERDADGDCTILKDLVSAFPRALRFCEYYSRYYESGNKKLNQIVIRDYLYVFPVEKAEMEKFMSLVPEDRFTAEVYDGFVVLHRIYSKEEAEKRKDFLLNTNGQSKGLWDMVDKYEGRRDPRPFGYIL